VLATRVSVLVSAKKSVQVLAPLYNTHPDTPQSCCMQYLLEERPCHQGIVQAPSLC